MKKIIVGILMAISGLSADDAQMEGKLRSWTKELDDMRASGNNLAASQESFAAYLALLGFCENQKPIPERILNKLRQDNFVDENGNIRANVCQIIKKIIAQTEEENKQH